MTNPAALRDYPVYAYALRFPNGTFYTGRVNSDDKPDYWAGPVHEAFTFSEAGAYRKRDASWCFRYCTVERVI